MKKYELCIGLNDKDTHKQKIKTEDAIEIIKKYMKVQKQSFSLSVLIGGYLHENGKDYIIENSIKLELLEIDKKLDLFINEFIKYSLRAFNQESIAKAVYEINSELVSF